MESIVEHDDERTIRLPVESFTAFRFMYGRPAMISQLSGTVLLGTISPFWIKQHQNGLLQVLTKSHGVVGGLKKMVSPRRINKGDLFDVYDDDYFEDEEPETHENYISDDYYDSNSDEYDDEAESDSDGNTGLNEQSGTLLPLSTVANSKGRNTTETADSFVTALEQPIVNYDTPKPRSHNDSVTRQGTPSKDLPKALFHEPESLLSNSSTPVIGKASRFETGTSTKSKIHNVKPTPELNGDLIQPLSKSHRHSFKLVKKIATKTKSRIANETVRNQKRIYDRISRKYSVGEIIKMEKMLVMIKAMQSNSTFAEFNELEPCDTRVLERWKEYIVVARSTDNVRNPILLQLYTKREIPDQFNSKHAERGYDFTLGKLTLVSLYNSLDKSISIVHNNRIYLLKCQTTTSAINWFSFLNSTLGKVKSVRDFKLQIPQINMSIDLTLSLELFKVIDKHRPYTYLITEPKGYQKESRPIIKFLIQRLCEKLQKSGYTEVAQVLQENKFVLGLCWRYYDRLEWLFGENIQNIFWQKEMNATHTLEFRTLQHYPIEVDGLKEPLPIEGFLSRLTSKTGDMKKGLFKKQIFKFSYVYTSNNLLFITGSLKALPPVPFDENTHLSKEASTTANFQSYYKNLDNDATPTIYEHNPYPIDENEHIKWLRPDISHEELLKRDKFAMFELERKIALLIRSEGVLDLSEIKEIVSYNPEKIPISTEITNALQWDKKFDPKILVNSKKVLESRKNCYFKIVMKNGVFTIFRAPTAEMKHEWMKRLIEMKDYWTKRTKEDLIQIRKIKSKNIQSLHIDEYIDSNSSISTLSRWEGLNATADPNIHNITAHSMFRPVIRSGYIFQKPKKHSSFRNLFVVLIPGYLILYKVFRKNFKGEAKSTAYHQHYMTIPISECYVYSGHICELDLVDQNSGHDLDTGHDPERHALPRVYDDGWSSSDDEISRCFTLWFGKKRAIARNKLEKTINRLRTNAGIKGDDENGESYNLNNESVENNPGLVRMVSRLGVTGKNMVFMCRSRQEKELWVSALNVMLERFGSFGVD